MGLIRNKFVYRGFKMVANYQYGQADVIGIQTPGNYVYFESWQQRHPKTKIEVLHNWLGPATNVGSTIQIGRTKLAGRKIFVYAGNMGVAQNTKIFLELAARIKGNREIGFLFVGRGSDRAALAAQYGDLENVLFYDEIDPIEMPGLYSQCNVGLVALDPRHKSHNIPGKFLSYIQGGLSVLACVNSGNDLIELINEHKVGVVIDGYVDGVQLVQGALKALALSEDPDAKVRCKYLEAGIFSSEGAASQVIASLSVCTNAVKCSGKSNV